MGLDISTRSVSSDKNDGMSNFCNMYTPLSGVVALPSLSPSGTGSGEVEARSKGYAC